MAGDSRGSTCRPFCFGSPSLSTCNVISFHSHIMACLFKNHLKYRAIIQIDIVWVWQHKKIYQIYPTMCLNENIVHDFICGSFCQSQTIKPLLLNNSNAAIYAPPSPSSSKIAISVLCSTFNRSQEVIFLKKKKNIFA